jgi:sulfite exporter TauE/SafE
VFEPLAVHALIFAAGVAGSMHCLGMCGGFACALAPDPRGRAATVRRHLVYNAGRVVTYGFLGAVAGWAGAEWLPAGAQRALAVVSGALMVYLGLQFFGVLVPRKARTAGALHVVDASALRAVLKSPRPAAPLAFGVLNGFLPCPLVYAFAVQAAASDGALPGMGVMLAFGLGTFPAMLAMGSAGAWLRAGPAGGARWRLQGVRAAGVFIVALGLITLARGVLPMTMTVHGA